jgi:hypothetical protein
VGLIGFFFENLATILGLFLLLQLAFCYALQTIADKQELSHGWMAWVPLLQIYPLVRAGGSSIQQFLVLLGVGVVAALAMVLLGPVGGLLFLGWGVWVLVYFVQLFWCIAEKRGLSGWVGLLAFLPVVNLFAYLYIAFHDGAGPPSKLGLVLGVVCFVLPAVPELRKAREMEALGSQLAPMANAAEQGDQVAMARLMHDMLQTMQGMESFEATEEERGALSQALAELAAVVGTSDDGASASEIPSAPLEVPELEPVSPNFRCPDGTRPRGAAPPHGTERWCERLDPERGPVRHGGYVSWHPGGMLHETGLYRDGERDGAWTRWYAEGGMQTQAEFRAGTQHGFQIDWSESGRREREIRYQHGKPIGR